MQPTRSPRTAVSLVLGVAVLALSGCAGDDPSSFDSAGATPAAADREKIRVIPPAEREPAPAVTGTTLKGKALRLDSFEGSVVVLNFWASWCGPCRDEVPVLQKVQKRTSGQGVRLLGVNVKDGKSNAKAFVRNFEIDYPSLYDQLGKVALRFRETVPPSALPSTIIIDRQGRVAGRIIGEAHYDQLMPMIRRVAGGGERSAQAGADAHEGGGT